MFCFFKKKQPITKGQKWVYSDLKDESPWQSDAYPLITILDYKDSWVRYNAAKTKTNN